MADTDESPQLAASIVRVVGCDLCQRYTRVLAGVEGWRYPYHKPNCPKDGEWLPVELRRLVNTPASPEEP